MEHFFLSNNCFPPQNYEDEERKKNQLKNKTFSKPNWLDIICWRKTTKEKHENRIAVGKFDHDSGNFCHFFCFSHVIMVHCIKYEREKGNKLA